MCVYLRSCFYLYHKNVCVKYGWTVAVCVVNAINDLIPFLSIVNKTESYT